MTILMRCVMAATLILSLSGVGGCIEQTCKKACERLDDCVGVNDMDDCIDDCIDNLNDETSACKKAYREMVDCGMEAACNDPLECLSEYEDAAAECDFM